VAARGFLGVELFFVVSGFPGRSGDDAFAAAVRAAFG
jgi:hypothetical protein